MFPETVVNSVKSRLPIGLGQSQMDTTVLFVSSQTLFWLRMAAGPSARKARCPTSASKVSQQCRQGSLSMVTAQSFSQGWLVWVCYEQRCQRGDEAFLLPLQLHAHLSMLEEVFWELGWLVRNMVVAPYVQEVGDSLLELHSQWDTCPLYRYTVCKYMRYTILVWRERPWLNDITFFFVGDFLGASHNILTWASTRVHFYMEKLLSCKSRNLSRSFYEILCSLAFKNEFYF